MNFLAHLYLSGQDPRIKVGNFIGDFVKGRLLSDRFEPRIALGIEMHRSIDLFTDHHPMVGKSKSRLRAKYRHYSGVIVDVFYDHFLARNWNTYHTEPLEQYVQNSYKTILDFDAILPDEVKRMMKYMVTDNWLLHYAEIDGIRQALTGMSRRTPYESRMNEAHSDLELFYYDFKSEFEAFFPVLQAWAEDWLSSHRQ